MAQDLHEVGVRVEELLAELTSVTDPAIHQRAEACERVVRMIFSGFPLQLAVTYLVPVIRLCWMNLLISWRGGY